MEIVRAEPFMTCTDIIMVVQSKQDNVLIQNSDKRINVNSVQELRYFFFLIDYFLCQLMHILWAFFET